MVEAASYKTPNQLHHITYKDKAAPPKDWSQFVLDPIPMQQLYDKLFRQMDQEALVSAANIRSFLIFQNYCLPPRKSLILTRSDSKDWTTSLLENSG